MFGGIVETTGDIQSIVCHDGCKTLRVRPQIHLADLTLGASISVNGVCLSVTEFTTTDFTVTVVPETLRLTNLDDLKEGVSVNLERAITMQTRMSGHMIQGHVDATGEIIDIQDDGGIAKLVKIKLPSRLQPYLVKKGYIAIDGMSITIIDCMNDWFTVTFIPHTQDVTIAQFYQTGKKVNLEVDIVGKYIAKMLEEKR